MLIGAAVTTVSIYEKEVINSFTKAANKYLKTKIDGNIVGLTLLDKFPQASITMENVVIHGSLESHKEKLAELEHIYFTISLIDLIQEKYNINSIYLEDGYINLYVNKNGENNYTFLEKENVEESTSELHFDFKNIEFVNTQINYENKRINQNHRVYANTLVGNLSVKNEITDINLTADCNTEYFLINETKYLVNKKLKVSGDLNVNTDEKTVQIPGLSSIISSSSFITKGNISYAKDSYSLKVNAENTDFKTLISLMPNQMVNGFKKYNSNGNASFTANIHKDNKKHKYPSIKIDFGCEKVSLMEPSTNIELKDLTVKGSFSNGKNRNSSSSILKLDDLKGSINGNPFQAVLNYQNFDNPLIESYVKGEFPISFLTQFADSNQLKNVYGSAKVDVKLKALQKDLEQGNHDAVTSSGQVEIKNVSFDNENDFYRFRNLSGSFMFNKDDIAISEFNGNVNSSDFNINGYLKGFFSHFFSKEDKLIVLGDFQANVLNFDDLIKTSHSAESTNVAIDNEYLKDIQFNLNAKVKYFNWGKFKIHNATGNLRHNNLVFTSNKLQGEIGNGGFNLSGTLDSRNTDNVQLKINTHVEGMEVDSIFYYFNDFNEEFITHKNLKGKVFINMIASMNFDKYLDLKPTTLLADIDIKAVNGELNDFEPMQNLSKFLGEDALKNIRFSELSNLIHIENEKIEIPDMRINSSVSNISLRGTHTFDHQIYYKLKVPLKNLKASKKKEAESAYETNSDGLTVHLIISGTTEDFTIKYDTKATTKVIKERVVQEIRDIKNIIKGNDTQEEDEEQIELNEEEYFEFEEDSTEF